ncbi:MAG: hypothetical protein IKS19_07680 [Clostridia bacterium]|nr:hypothetical protein [Clostridia bacterium]
MDKNDTKKIIFAIVAIVAFAASVATATYFILTKIKKRRETREIEKYLDCVIE